MMELTHEEMSVDQLYELLPVVYRQRDAAEGYPLKALLQVIGEQVALVEGDIEQLYENWFVETADSWVIPYIGELIGYSPVRSAGRLGDTSSVEDQQLNKVLVPRREVTNTIRYRRRKGTLALLEELARDVSGWQARAVEFARLLGMTQSINHLQPQLGQTIDFRNQTQLLNLNTPFDTGAHTIDVRRLNSQYQRGFYHPKNVGVFVWRLRAYPVTMMSPYLLEDIGTHCFTFSILGNSAPLFTKTVEEASEMTLASELNVPTPIRRMALHQNLAAYYGEGKSFAIYREVADHEYQLVPVEEIVVADLHDWFYQPDDGMIAVDPELGRFVVSAQDRSNGDIRVTYHYGFSADLGGGEYGRKLSQSQNATTYRIIPTIDDEKANRIQGLFPTIGKALDYWKEKQPAHAIIEISENGVYTEQLHIKLAENQTLQIRSANHVRPVLRLLDFQASRSDALRVQGKEGSAFTIDGLLISGRGLLISGPMSDVTVRHSTLVPGWTLTPNCDPIRPAEPSLILRKTSACLTIEKSIVGSIQVKQDEVSMDPPPIIVRDSIIDATDTEQSAVDAPSWPLAHAMLTVLNSTVIGTVDVHAIELAENSIFMGRVKVGRSQIGCMRFCYVPDSPDARTPKQYNCQPNNVIADIERAHALRRKIQTLKTEEAELDSSSPSYEDDLAKIIKSIELYYKQMAQLPEENFEIATIVPRFNSMRYGTSRYAQLSESCAVEIKRGAEDESEMGVFYHLYQPQRTASLKARLEEYTPADINVGIIFAS